MHSLTFLAYALSLALASTSLSTAFKITVVNKCPEPISVAASQADVLTTDKSPELEAVRPFPALEEKYTGSEPLAQGESFEIIPPAKWMGGRVWGRTGCKGTGAAMVCETGNCNAGQFCTGYDASWTEPMLLAEFGYGYKDAQQPSPNGYCNLSRVTGFDFAKSLDGIATPKKCLSSTCAVEGGAYANPDDHLAMEGGMYDINTGELTVTFCPEGKMTARKLVKLT